jgi:hypothetical protein
MELDLQKFIWAPCAQLYSVAEIPQLIVKGAIGQPKQTTSLCDPSLNSNDVFTTALVFRSFSRKAFLQIYTESDHLREGMGQLEYQTMPSLRDVAHCTFTIHITAA